MLVSMQASDTHTHTHTSLEVKCDFVGVFHGAGKRIHQRPHEHLWLYNVFMYNMCNISFISTPGIRIPSPIPYVVVAVATILDDGVKHNGLAPATQAVAVVDVRCDADAHDSAFKGILEAGSMGIAELGNGGSSGGGACGAIGRKHAIVAKIPGGMWCKPVHMSNTWLSWDQRT